MGNPVRPEVSLFALLGGLVSMPGVHLPEQRDILELTTLPVCHPTEDCGPFAMPPGGSGAAHLQGGDKQEYPLWVFWFWGGPPRLAPRSVPPQP